MNPVRTLVIAVSLGAALCLGGRTATANPDLKDAKLALADLDFEQARTRLDRALRWGRNSPAQMVEILRLAGEVQAALGDTAGAEQHFFEMFTLDPSVALPTGASPKLTEPFSRARARSATSGALTATCELDPRGPAVKVRVTSDPASLLAGARAIYRLPGTSGAAGSLQTVEVHGRENITLVLPQVDGLQLYCALIDTHGNHLREIGSPTDFQTLRLARGKGRDTTGPGPGPAVPSQPFFKHWATYGVLALVAGGAGGFFAYRVRAAENDLAALNTESGEHDFSDAQVIQSRGRRNAIFANISLGVAGICAVVSVIQLLRRPTGSDESERAALIAPTLMPGGAGLLVSAEF